MRIERPASNAGAPVDHVGKPEEIQANQTQKIQEHNEGRSPASAPGLTPLEEQQARQLADTIKAEREQEADQTKDRIEKNLEESKFELQVQMQAKKRKDENQ